MYSIALSVTRRFTLSNSFSAFVWNTGSYRSSSFVRYVMVFSRDKGCPRLKQVERLPELVIVGVLVTLEHGPNGPPAAELA